MVRRSWVYALAAPSIHSTRWSQIGPYWPRIAISAYPTCIRRPRLRGPTAVIAMTFGIKKTRMVWLPEGKKMGIRFVLTESTNVKDRRTDTQTDTAWRHRPRLHSIARQKLLIHMAPGTSNLDPRPTAGAAAWRIKRYDPTAVYCQFSKFYNRCNVANKQTNNIHNTDDQQQYIGGLA